MEQLLIPIMILCIGMVFYNIFRDKECEETNKRLANLDLNEQVGLRFPKCEFYWGRRYVQFYNPVVQEWWWLPKEDVKAPELWSFKKYGFTDKYHLNNVYQVEDRDIESFKKKYKTLGDIQDHFERCNDRYYQLV